MANKKETPAVTMSVGKIIKTRAPKAVEAGTKPEGWFIEFLEPFELTIEALISQYGADVVYASAVANLRVGFQNAVRTYAEAGRSDEEINTLMDSWIPGMHVSAPKDPVTAILGSFGNMSAEKQAELLAMLADRAI